MNYKTPVLYSLLVLLFIAGGISFWQSQNQTTPKNWKTFVNKEYGFEIKFPANLYDKTEKAREYSDHILLDIQNTPLQLELGGAIPDGVDGKDFSTTGYYFNISTVKKSLINRSQLQKVANQNLTIYTWSGPSDGLSSGTELYIESPTISDEYIDFSYGARCDRNTIVQICDGIDTEKLFTQILSTFKFTK